MEYINRINALEAEQSYSLTNDGIACQNNVISYREINSIRLKYVPTRYYSNIYQCEISHSKGSLTLCNRKFIKLGTFEYQSKSYNKFVTQLHEQLTEDVRLSAGMDRVRYWIELPIAICFFAFIIGMIFIFGHLILAGLTLFIVILRLIPYYRRNYPVRYHRNIIPNHILPIK